MSNEVMRVYTKNQPKKRPKIKPGKTQQEAKNDQFVGKDEEAETLKN